MVLPGYKWRVLKGSFQSWEQVDVDCAGVGFLVLDRQAAEIWNPAHKRHGIYQLSDLKRYCSDSFITHSSRRLHRRKFPKDGSPKITTSLAKIAWTRWGRASSCNNNVSAAHRNQYMHIHLNFTSWKSTLNMLAFSKQCNVPNTTGAINSTRVSASGNKGLSKYLRENFCVFGLSVFSPIVLLGYMLLYDRLMWIMFTSTSKNVMMNACPHAWYINPTWSCAWQECAKLTWLKKNWLPSEGNVHIFTDVFRFLKHQLKACVRGWSTTTNTKTPTLRYER